jgi:hypothetical protein
MKHTIKNKLINVITYEFFDAHISTIEVKDKIQFKGNFKFNWIEIINTDGVISVKLTVEDNQTIQAAMAYTLQRGYIEIKNIERRNYKKLKVYKNLLQILVAAACALSFDIGNDGYISFDAKTKLIPYYQKILGATLLFGTKMEINTSNSKKLVSLYHE